MSSDTTKPSNSTEMMRGVYDRLLNLQRQKRAIAADIKQVGKEITNLGFSHRVMNKIANAELAREDGKEKPMQNLREESGDLALYLDVLAPQSQTQEAAE